MRTQRTYLFIFLFLLTVLTEAQTLIPAPQTWAAIPGQNIEYPVTMNTAWAGTTTVFAYNAPGGRSIAANNQPTFIKTGTTLKIQFAAAQTNRMSRSTFIQVSTGGTVRYNIYLILTKDIAQAGDTPGGQFIQVPISQVSGLPTFVGQTKLTLDRMSRDFTDAAAKYRDVPWWAIGNSITAYGNYTGPLALYSGMIQNNIAVAGSTIAGFQASPNPGYEGGMYRTIKDNLPASTAPNVITWMCCINDFRLNAALGVLGDTTKNTVYGALYQGGKLIKQRQPNAQLFMLTEYGNVDKTYTGNYFHVNDIGLPFQAYQQAVRDMAEVNGAVLIDVGQQSGIGGNNIIQNTVDSIHISQSGGIRLANFIWSKIRVQDRSPQLPPAPSPGIYITSPVALGQISGAGVTVNGINSDSTINYSSLPGFGFPVLWFNAGNNAVLEFDIATPVGDNGFWVTYGDGSEGYSGVGTSFTAGLHKFTANGIFVAATGNANVYGTASPPGAAFSISSGDHFRVRRAGTVVIIEKRSSDGTYGILLNYDIAQQSGSNAIFYTNPRLGVLVLDGTFATVKNVKIGTYIPGN
jgi:hypothetical protein